MFVKDYGFNGPDNDIFSIHKSRSYMYTLNSTDNILYDLVFNPLNITSRYRTTFREVLIKDKRNFEEKKIIFIDPVIIILDNSDLIIITENNIYILDCYSLLVKRSKTFATYPDFFKEERNLIFCNYTTWFGYYPYPDFPKEKKNLITMYKLWDSYVIILNTGSEFIPQIIKLSYEFKQEWTHYCNYCCYFEGIYGENIMISTPIGDYFLDEFGQENAIEAT